jgi:pyrophosphate--fructose-6-phosphate 1-phosphotransferase
MTQSPLSLERMKYQPKLPQALRDGLAHVKVEKGAATESVRDQEKIRALFPHTYGAPIVRFTSGKVAEVRPLRVGVVLSGGQAPGGHNVIAGIFDGIKSLHPESKLLGFLGGPQGLVDGKFIEITAELMNQYRNTGGFDIIGSGRTKLESEAQFTKCIEVSKNNHLDSIVIIGGDDSNTNAAVLAEYFIAKKADCCIIGCPKTIDGDLKNEYVEAPFGFDTAAKTYALLVGNIARDARSAKKYWHFIKVMGRSASHLALEVALQTHPNYCFISEEVEARGWTLNQVVKDLADVVAARASAGKNYGVVLIPEGLIEFIPEVKKLIHELNDTLANHVSEVNAADSIYEKVALVGKSLTSESSRLLMSLPQMIQQQLLLDRDPHGNVQVSLIETEKLLMEMVGKELKSRADSNAKFKSLGHFLGYEGRCAAPSNFDADYGYSLGYAAAVLAHNRMTGYMSSVSNLAAGAGNWQAGGIPISMLMNMERRHGADKPVIQKALVDLNDEPFKAFVSYRNAWAKADAYLDPGSIQYFGPSSICDAVTKTLHLESLGKKK